MITNKEIIIFDFDGTLVDTMHIFANVASNLIFEHYGMPKEEARKKYFETSGLPFQKQLEVIFPGNSKNLSTAPIYEKWKLIATENVVMDEDTKKALNTLKKCGCGLAISSNNFQYNIDHFIVNNNLKDIFKIALGFKDNFGKGEAHFSFIADKLKIGADKMLFVGDSINDARLAKENNIDFMGRTGTFSEKDFKRFDKTIKCIKNISDLIKI